MKKYIMIYTLLLSNFCVFAQQDTDRKALMKAKIMLLEHRPEYNPRKAFLAFSSLARQGNAEAMNALGMFYMQGLAVAENDSIAVKLFRKAALAGYGKAWYNWGTMYKHGNGVKQDFKKAYNIFSEGARRGYSSSYYSAGYMHYHGQGCPQDYVKAVAMFKEGVSRGSLGSMYMLGLCYRNGYGTAVNADSARYWLQRSFDKGYGQAGEELATLKPENPGAATGNLLTMTEGAKDAGIMANGTVTPTQETYSRIKHLPLDKKIAGEYIGYIIRYDYSGRHVISKSPLKLSLAYDKGKLRGQWTEADTLHVQLNAEQADSSIVFNQTAYNLAHRYNQRKPELYEFKEARLQLSESEGTVSIAGNVQLWNVQQREPGYPVYISLERENPGNKNLNIIAQQQPDKQKQLEGNLLNESKGVVVYPNPFDKHFTAEFYLPKQADVELQLSDMNGRILYLKELSLPEGQHSHIITVQVPQGVYAFRLQYGKEVKNSIVIKQ